MASKMNKTLLTGQPEKFVHLGDKVLDTKNRINLGEKIAKLVFDQTGADSFQLFYGETGDLLLRPILAMPVKEVWLYKNPGAFAKVKKGLTEAKTGRRKKIADIKEYLKKL